MSALVIPRPSTSPDLYFGKYVAGMFANSEPGGWWDFTDLSTMFIDPYGQVPAEVGKPVGLVLDKKNGFRVADPIVVFTEFPNNIGNAYWTKDNSTAVTENAALAPDGTMTADRAVIPGSSFGVYRRVNMTISSGSFYMVEVYLRADAPASINIGINGLTNGANNQGTRVDLDENWKLCRVPLFSAASDSGLFALISSTNSVGGGTANITQPVTVYIWGARLVSGGYIGANLRAFQNAAFQTVTTKRPLLEVDQSGIYRLRPDGIDDFLLTNAFDFRSTRAVTIFSAVQTNNRGTYQFAVQQNFMLNGHWFQAVKSTSNNQMEVGWRGSGSAVWSRTPSDTSGLYLGKMIATTQIDLSAASQLVTQRVNGVSRMPVDAIPNGGPGPFASAPISIGASTGGTQYFLDGGLYGVVVRGARTDAAHIANVERYLANKSGVLL